MDVGSGWAIVHPVFDSFRVQAEIINLKFPIYFLLVENFGDFNFIRVYCLTTKIIIRGVNDGWAEWAVAHPCFGRHV